MSDSWKIILGQELPLGLLLGDPNEELGRWHSPTEMLVNDLRQADKFYKTFTPDDPVVRSMVSESNHRAMFNHILAQSVLELPYAPSSARWPFRRFLDSACKEWRDVVLHPNVAELPSVRILEKHYQTKVGEVTKHKV